MRTLLAFFIGLSAFGQGIPFPGVKPPAAAPSYLFQETFEGSTACYGAIGSYCDNAWYYIQTMTANYATTPAPLQGARSLRDDGTAGSGAYANFAAQSTVWASVITNYSVHPDADQNVIELVTSGDTSLCRLWVYGQYIIARAGGGTQQSASVTLSNATNYYFKIKYVKGSGSNASCTGYYSTNGSSWTSVVSSDGTVTEDASRVRSVPSYVSGTHIFDDFRVSTSDITYP